MGNEDLSLKEATIYVVCERMAKFFRTSIRHMPIDDRKTIGRDINVTLRKVKALAYISTETHTYNSLYRELIKLKVLVDECIEDNLLRLKGTDNIIIPRNLRCCAKT